MKSRTLKQTLAAVISATLLLASFGCGEPKQSEDTGGDSAAVGDEGMPVSGQVKFVSQCPHGYRKPLPPAELTAWDCPLPLQSIELDEAPRPIVVMADCKKKILTIRSEDGSVDNSWEVMPDGSFLLSMDDLTAKLKNDGTQGACISHLSTDVVGKLECKDRDQVDIKLEMVYRLNKGRRTTATTLPECQVPDKCYMYAAATLQQCQ